MNSTFREVNFRSKMPYNNFLLWRHQKTCTTISGKSCLLICVSNFSGFLWVQYDQVNLNRTFRVVHFRSKMPYNWMQIPENPLSYSTPIFGLDWRYKLFEKNISSTHFLFTLLVMLGNYEHTCIVTLKIARRTTGAKDKKFVKIFNFF